MRADAQKKLQGERLQEKFLALTLDMVFAIDLDGYCQPLNSTCETILGLTAEELQGQLWLELIHPEDRASTQSQLQQLSGGADKVTFECRFCCKDGSEKWLLSNATFCSEQQVVYVVARDNTDSRQLEAARGKIAAPNFSQAPQDKFEQRVEERTAELTQINERLKQEITKHERTEARLRQSKAYLKKQAQQLEAETHRATTLLKELQQTQAQLIQTEKMSSLGQLVAGVAHEINNPVSFIYCNLDYANCYIQDLMRLVKLFCSHNPEPAPEIQAEMDAIDFDFLMADMPKLLASMKVGANRIRQVVLSLQNFLRAEQVKMKPVDIHEGLDSTLLILQHRLKPTAEHPEITVSKNYGTLPLVECYAGLLNQVFINLLANAIDVLNTSSLPQNAPRQIAISTGIENIRRESNEVNHSNLVPHAVIRIADNGPGMSEEVSRRLFDPFFTTKPVGKGTGLGLSISYQIVVEKHGGQLTCISEPGQGAEFAIAIPIRQRDTSETLSECA
jgi:PAS domain S-box-containing protein